MVRISGYRIQCTRRGRNGVDRSPVCNVGHIRLLVAHVRYGIGRSKEERRTSTKIHFSATSSMGSRNRRTAYVYRQSPNQVTTRVKKASIGELHQVVSVTVNRRCSRNHQCTARRRSRRRTIDEEPESQGKESAAVEASPMQRPTRTQGGTAPLGVPQRRRDPWLFNLRITRGYIRGKVRSNSTLPSQSNHQSPRRSPLPSSPPSFRFRHTLFSGARIRDSVSNGRRSRSWRRVTQLPDRSLGANTSSVTPVMLTCHDPCRLMSPSILALS
ncbi:hypothetical protein QBC46DRAFT_149226 [Diplogelasinospora grovesii]|uniref:Uncharacterized protein n=1 Tax=Diplogelasinospora grovesii TaxID=303347 RepID=A0AAN6S378_9PEZI|nr:hypothetical protein QBC46DRAFT_149226 [Diplogelasinospora grovesii]